MTLILLVGMSVALTVRGQNIDENITVDSTRYTTNVNEHHHCEFGDTLA